MIISRGSNYDTIQTKHFIIQNVYKQASCPLNKVKKKAINVKQNENVKVIKIIYIQKFSLLQRAKN